LGYLAIQRMQWDLAASYVKKALEKDPKNELYLKNWAKIQAKSSLK
jgi:Tfp pilus assembly protein PilF